MVTVGAKTLGKQNTQNETVKRTIEQIRNHGRTLGGQLANMKRLTEGLVTYVGAEPMPLDAYLAISPFEFKSYCRGDTGRAKQMELGLETIGLLANLLVRMNDTSRELETLMNGLAREQRTEEVRNEFRRVLGVFNSDLGLYELAVKVSKGTTEVEPLFDLILLDRRPF